MNNTKQIETIELYSEETNRNKKTIIAIPTENGTIVNVTNYIIDKESGNYISVSEAITFVTEMEIFKNSTENIYQFKDLDR